MTKLSFVTFLLLSAFFYVFESKAFWDRPAAADGRSFWKGLSPASVRICWSSFILQLEQFMFFFVFSFVNVSELEPERLPLKSFI